MESESPLAIERRNGQEGLPAEVLLKPWKDELVEAVGYDARSIYVEMCWLPIMGPTATWLFRRLGSWAEFNPDGLTVDMTDLAVSLGLGEGLGRSSLLNKAMDRLLQFGVARWGEGELQVRQALAPLSARHARRLSYTACRFHEEITRNPKGTFGGGAT